MWYRLSLWCCCPRRARERMQLYANDFVSEKVKHAWDNARNSKGQYSVLLTFAGGRA